MSMDGPANSGGYRYGRPGDRAAKCPDRTAEKLPADVRGQRQKPYDRLPGAKLTLQSPVKSGKSAAIVSTENCLANDVDNDRQEHQPGQEQNHKKDEFLFGCCHPYVFCLLHRRRGFGTED